ncbi:MAG: PAS domain S-box protein [Planctomycetaceae bacterium]|nr:PAS domain S-box protein [Planctomycetaceae bacterium]
MSDRTDVPVNQQGSDAENAAVLRSILDAAIDAIITIDEMGTILDANRATERMFGFSRQELVGGNVSRLMPSPYREEHDGYLKAYLQTGSAKIIGVGREIAGRHKDGSLIPIDLAVSETRVGQRRLFTGILRDMSERNRVETALRRERHFAKDLESTANAIVLILDPLGRIIRFNPFAEQITQYRLVEVQGHDWFDRFMAVEEQGELREVFQSVATGRQVSSHVSSLVTRDGRKKLVAWSYRQLIDSDGVGDGVLMIGTDVTDLKDAERKLIQSERLAAIGQMVTGLAHESRNALQRARGCLDLLELDVEAESGQLELVHRTQSALDELQRLYDEVRNYAAPLKLDYCPCDLEQLCRETWHQVQEAHHHPQVELKLNLPNGWPPCECDHARIQQVLRNIFENAMHVSPDHGRIALSAREVWLDGEPCLEIRIRDEGPGLSEDDCVRIFEPFYTTKTKGTGLGLAISRRIVEAHGGTLVASAGSKNGPSGPGVEIVIRLPQRRPRSDVGGRLPGRPPSALQP